jgi:hypothetical protein
MSLVNSAQLAKALQIHENKVSGTSTKIYDALVKTRLRKGSFDKVFPAMFSIHYKDLAEITRRELTNKTSTIAQVRAIEEAFSLMIEELSGLEKATPEFMTKVIADIDAYVALMNSSIISGTVNSKSWKALDPALAKIRANFKTPKVIYYVPSDSKSLGSIKLVYDSFNNLRAKVNTTFKKYLSQQVDDNNDLIIPDYENIAKDIFNFGHTTVEGTNKSLFLSGKLLAEILSTSNTSIMSSERNLDTIKVDFIQQTGQINTKITMHQGITASEQAVFNLVIESGYFQPAKFQHVQENQGELSSLEMGWGIVSAASRTGLLSAFGVSTESELANQLIKVRSSPSLIDKITAKIISGISGDKISIPTSIITKTLVDKSTKVYFPEVVITRQGSRQEAKVNRARGLKGQFISPVSIKNLLNASLARQIQQNMGKGRATQVLNYRSGRFANSAEVTQVTNRGGAITAFYSYMKNPYETFAPGGAQGSPASRDPNKLIQTSIRQIATTIMKDRLKVVPV